MQDLSPALAPGVVSEDAAPPSPLSAASPATCATCGTPHHGEFCFACGQRAVRERFTLRGIVTKLVTDAFDLDRGLLFTAVELFRRPGAAIRAYVQGATVRYANPVKYLVVCVALAVFASVQVGVTREMAGGFAEGGGPGSAETVERVSEFLGRYMNVLMAAAVPFMAAASRVLFRRAGFNLAEHLIFNVYVYAQQSLLFLPFLPLFLAGSRSAWPVAAYTLAITAYYAWAATAFFQARPLAGTLRALLVTLVGTAVYVLLVGTVMVLALVASGAV